MISHNALHGGLKVALIATPKKEFLSCSPNDIVYEVAERNVDKFDFMPVIDDKERIVGVIELAPYFREPGPQISVSTVIKPLNEEFLIGADSSIYDFLLDADTRRFRFVISQSGVVGLVSLSDMQKLPVRATLFSLVTALEIQMLEVIGSRLPQSDDWLQLISQERRKNVNDMISRAKLSDGIVNELLFTQFCDKRVIIQKSLLAQHPQRKIFERKMKKIEILRNALAHANMYAETTEQAVEVCKTIRSISDIRKLLNEVV